MGNKLKEIFNPTPEQKQQQFERYLQIHKELSVKRGCSTCKHCKHVLDLPGFVTGEECECDVGLQCDTVLFRIKNCELWEDSLEQVKLEYSV